MKSIHDLVIAALIATPLFASVLMLALAIHDGAPTAPSSADHTTAVTTHGY